MIKNYAELATALRSNLTQSGRFAFPPERVIAFVDDDRVATTLVSSTPGEGAMKLWEIALSRVVPVARTCHGEGDAINWMSAPGMLEYLGECPANTHTISEIFISI